MSGDAGQTFVVVAAVASGTGTCAGGGASAGGLASGNAGSGVVDGKTVGTKGTSVAGAVQTAGFAGRAYSLFAVVGSRTVLCTVSLEIAET